MEQIKTSALVIKETEYKDNDKLLTLLSSDYGRITVTGKGLSSLKNKNMSSSQLFCYSEFVLKKTGKYFYISESVLIENFFDLRFDIEKIALANYICDLAYEFSLEESEQGELLSLTLNTLYALCNKDDYSLLKIKSSFELKLLCISGYLPSVDSCEFCGKKVNDVSYFDIINGTLICGDCVNLPDTDKNNLCNVSMNILAAIRYISDSGLKRYLLFSLDDNELMKLNELTERFMLSIVEHSFNSLIYLNNLIEI